MNKLLTSLKEYFANINKKQKIIVFSVLGVLVLAIILLISINSSPHHVPIISRNLTEEEISSISDALDKNDIKHFDKNSKIFVANELVARKARNIIAMENLIPKQTDPWELFDVNRWSTTDFQNNINLRRSIQKQLTLHIEALDDIDKASVSVMIPDDSNALPFEAQQSSKISVVITPKPSSDIEKNQKKIKGIVNLIKTAVPGVVLEENIAILNTAGQQLNDEERFGTEVDKNKELINIEEDIENKYFLKIQNALGKIYKDRIQIVNIDVVFDAGKWTQESTEITPIILAKDNPNTPSNEAKILDKVEVSAITKESHYKGNGEVPNGPPGSESQTNINYADEQKNFGQMDQKESTVNYQSNIKKKNENGTPSIKNINVGIMVDGIYKIKYDEKGRVVKLPGERRDRDYTQVSPEEVKLIEDTIKASINFNSDRGDQIKVSGVQFDRTKQFNEEDANYFKEKYTKYTVLSVVLGIIGIILLIVLIIYLNRERQKREEERRQREEAARIRREREEELRRLEEQNKPLELTGEERDRMELQENASSFARERPEEVAQLIRTWLLEE